MKARRAIRVFLGVGLLGAALLGLFLSTYPGTQALPYAMFLWRARPVQALEEDPATPLPVLRNLENLREARRYAASLGLAVGDAYSTISDDGGGPLVWVVTAARRDRLESVAWRYPLVGSLSYRGFFTRDEADGFAETLREQGLDTWVRGAPAFSALGLFPEPLPTSVLAWPEEGLTGLVVHETLHRTVFFPGQTDFNETLATFVERQALLDRAADPAALQERWNRGERLHRRLKAASEELEELYRDRPEEAPLLRERVFAALARDLEEIQGRPDPHPWNNARLLGSLAYVGELDRMGDLYRRLGSDLPAFIGFFAGLDREADPWEQVERNVAATSRSSPAAR